MKNYDTNDQYKQHDIYLILSKVNRLRYNLQSKSMTRPSIVGHAFDKDPFMEPGSIIW